MLGTYSVQVLYIDVRTLLYYCAYMEKYSAQALQGTDSNGDCPDTACNVRVNSVLFYPSMYMHRDLRRQTY